MPRALQLNNLKTVVRVLITFRLCMFLLTNESYFKLPIPRKAPTDSLEEVAEMVVDPGLDRVARRGGEGEYRHLITVAAQGGLCPLRRLEPSARRLSAALAAAMAPSRPTMRIAAESG